MLMQRFSRCLDAGDDDMYVLTILVLVNMLVSVSLSITFKRKVSP